jgi:DNA-directed RNA polymerase specialized sigma24 family protein
VARIFAVDPLAEPEPLVRRVYSYVAYRIGDGPDAEDVTSDVFERALRYRHGYDPSKGEPAAWLIGIARRQIEIPRRWATASPDEDVAALGDLEEEAVRRLTLSSAVAKLNEREREPSGTEPN